MLPPLRCGPSLRLVVAVGAAGRAQMWERRLHSAVFLRAGRRHAALGPGSDSGCFCGESRSFGLLPAASSFVVVLLLSLRVAVLRNPLQDELLGRCGRLVLLLQRKRRVESLSVEDVHGLLGFHYFPRMAITAIVALE